MLLLSRYFSPIFTPAPQPRFGSPVLLFEPLLVLLSTISVGPLDWVRFISWVSLFILLPLVYGPSIYPILSIHFPVSHYLVIPLPSFLLTPVPREYMHRSSLFFFWYHQGGTLESTQGLVKKKVLVM